jgi:hypothetical protein
MTESRSLRHSLGPLRSVPMRLPGLDDPDIPDELLATESLSDNRPLLTLRVRIRRFTDRFLGVEVRY